jgi:hypothetical protein
METPLFLWPSTRRPKLPAALGRYLHVEARRLAALAAISLALAAPAAAGAEDAPFVGWSALLPGLSLPYDPQSSDHCSAGRVQCVDKTIRDMDQRVDSLASTCDHNAVFALTYLLVTEEYRRTVEGPFFDDTPFVNYEDYVFARYYFAAFDAWAGGRIERVPPAWRIAFAAARSRAVSASGDMLLGINAHVQRDLPLVLYAIGFVRPDGTSRKPDHDRVNVILNRVSDDIIAEIARRFDPTVDDADLPTRLDDAALFQTLAGWREKAWRNAERLAAAPTAEARELVVAEIENDAATEARAIVAATGYPPLSGGSSARAAFCASHGEDG